MLFSKLCKIIANKITFVGFRGGDRPNRPPWIRPWVRACSVLNCVRTVCSLFWRTTLRLFQSEKLVFSQLAILKSTAGIEPTHSYLRIENKLTTYVNPRWFVQQTVSPEVTHTFAFYWSIFVDAWLRRVIYICWNVISATG